MSEYIGTKFEFDELLENAGKKLVIVEFTAEYCIPCKEIAAKYAALVKKYKPHINMFKIDVDENAETAESQEVFEMPTF